MSEKKVGSFTLDYTMRVKEFTLADKTYHFKQPVELSPGAYNMFVDGDDVSFEKTTGLMTEEYKRLARLLDWSEHQ